MRRMLMAGIAVAFPLVGALAYAGTSAAATGVTCTKLVGSVNLVAGTDTVTISGCNDTANTGGGGTEHSTITATTGKITWKSSKGTTTFKNITTTVVTTGATCASGDTEEQTITTVSGGTGAAKNSIKAGWTSKSFVCYDSSDGKLSLAPGTKYQIGPGL